MRRRRAARIRTPAPIRPENPDPDAFHPLQTDDIGAFTTLMENARFVSALAALEKIPAFRCLISLRVPDRLKLVLKAWMLSPLSGREGLVLIRMVDSPREAAAIRQDLALLCEIRDAMAEVVP